MRIFNFLMLLFIRQQQITDDKNNFLIIFSPPSITFEIKL